MASRSRRLLFALATSKSWEKAVLGLPRGERAAYRLACRYVAGRTREDAFAVAQRLANEGLACSIDLFGESVTDPDEADRVADAYVSLAAALKQAPADTFLSLDLSHIGLDGPANDVQATVRANLKRSLADARKLAEAGVPIRLVKGAYVEDPAVAHTWGEATDLAFLELGYELHRAGAEIALGTHDPVLREALLQALPGIGIEMLLGVRPSDARSLAARSVPVGIYVPYGEGWFRYAMRRFAESRGA
jgi:proline dehydrogenase